MRLLQWHHVFDSCTDLDQMRARWDEVAQEHYLNPGHGTPEYRDALLSFIATSPLPAPLKLGAVLSCVSGFDFDLRLALGALGAQVDEADVEWTGPFGIEATLLGPGMRLDTQDAQVASFVLGRLTGLRDTLRQYSTTAYDWEPVFWRAYLELACRWADLDALELALQHGVTVDQAGAAVLTVLAEGVHMHTPYYNAGRSHADYVAVLDRLLALGLDTKKLSEVMVPAAAAVDNTDMLESLLARGTDLHGAGALTTAASSAAHGAVEWLLAHGADVHADGEAALAGAAAALDETLVETLLAAGADLHAGEELPLRTAFGTQPFELYNGETEFVFARAELVLALLRHGADAAHPAVALALREAEDGEAVLEALLERDDLEEPHRAALVALGAAAFGKEPE
jgi:hypothetical protein